MKRQTKAKSIAFLIKQLRLVLSKLKPHDLINLIDNFDDLKKYIQSIRSLKEKVSLQCLKINAISWGWTQDQQDKMGETMTVVNSAKDVWSQPDAELLDTDKSKFGQATINKETPPDFENPNIKVLTEKELFPNIDFTQEANRLHAIHRFIYEVEKLNRVPNGKRYYIPGLEYMEYLHQNPDKTPANIKDENYYIYAGANFRNHDGRLLVPGSAWDGSSLNRRRNYVSTSWASDNRFLVLEI